MSSRDGSVNQLSKVALMRESGDMLCPLLRRLQVCILKNNINNQYIDMIILATCHLPLATCHLPLATCHFSGSPYEGLDDTQLVRVYLANGRGKDATPIMKWFLQGYCPRAMTRKPAMPGHPRCALLHLNSLPLAGESAARGARRQTNRCASFAIRRDT